MSILSIYILSKKNAIGKDKLALLFISTCIYCAGYAMELICTNLNEMLYWNLVQYAGMPFISAFWLLYSIEYAGRGYLLKPGIITTILSIPILIIIMRFTNSLHNLYYINTSIMMNSDFPVMLINKGPFYFLLSFSAFAMVLISIYFYSIGLKNNNGKINSQGLLMFIAALIPPVSTVINFLNVIPNGVDIGPFFLLISFIFFIYSLYRYQMLDIMPVVRDKVFEMTHDVVIVLDRNYRVLDFNPAAGRVFSELNREVLGLPVDNVLTEHEMVVDAIWNSKGGQMNLSVQGKIKCFNMLNLPIMRKKHITGYLLVFNDITSYMETIKSMDVLASIDGLTGILNRRSFLERSKLEVMDARAKRTPITIMMLDIDRFKDVNDRMGHPAGDKALKAVADVCRVLTRTIDILGRVGGEEFALVLPGTPIELGLVVAERLRKGIQDKIIESDGTTFNVTASIGVTDDKALENDDIETMLKRADKAMYQAKSSGRNCVYFI
jgi:diguanylate cyclase (GGDEF)-like protein